MNIEPSNYPSKWHLQQEYFLRCLFGWIPVSPGCRLRRLAYRFIFNYLGKGAYIEPGVGFSNSRRIWLGDGASLFRDVCLDIHGKNSQICIGDRAKLERGVNITVGGDYPNCKIEIGENTFIGPYVCIAGPGDIKIGKDCLIAAQTGIFANNHIFENPQQIIREQGVTYKGITIEDDCWLGTKVSVLDGITIGKGSVIGAGAIVTKSIPPYSIAVGVPARVIGQRDEKVVAKTSVENKH